MNKQISLSNLEDELSQVRTKKKEFLEQIERIVPWNEWVAMIKPCYYKGECGNKQSDSGRRYAGKIQKSVGKKRAAGKAFFTGGRAAHSKRTDSEKGNDSRFNDNSSADLHEKQGTQT